VLLAWPLHYPWEAHQFNISILFAPRTGPQTVIPSTDGFGFIVGKGTIHCGGGNTINFVVAADHDETLVAPMVIHSVAEGYMVSVCGAGIYANQRLIDKSRRQISDEDANPREETTRLFVTNPLYLYYASS